MCYKSHLLCYGSIYIFQLSYIGILRGNTPLSISTLDNSCFSKISLTLVGRLASNGLADSFIGLLIVPIFLHRLPISLVRVILGLGNLREQHDLCLQNIERFRLSTSTLLHSSVLHILPFREKRFISISPRRDSLFILFSIQLK